jgi:plastocyanin
MKPALRDRLVLPVLLPIGIVVVIGAVLYGLSRILLSITPTAATFTALVVAIGIVAAASFAAASKQVRISTLGAMVGGVAGVAMLAGGIALAVVAGEGEGGEEERPVVTLAAANIAFEPASLTAPAGEPFTLQFHNQDAGTQHDVDIFDNPDLSGAPVLDGEVVTGVRQVDYMVEALAPGPYTFRCSIHAQMTGELEAVEGEGAGDGGGEGGGGEGGAGGVTVVAQGTAFDTSTIELPPSAPTTITFDNRDAGVQHNIAIYTDDSLSDELFNGDVITGPATVEYPVPPIDPGSYYFLCVVHPTMNGSVEVAAGGEGGGTGGTGGTGPPEPTGPS